MWCLSVHLSIRLSVGWFMCLSVRLSVCLSACLLTQALDALCLIVCMCVGLNLHMMNMSLANLSKLTTLPVHSLVLLLTTVCTAFGQCMGTLQATVSCTPSSQQAEVTLVSAGCRTGTHSCAFKGLATLHASSSTHSS